MRLTKAHLFSAVALCLFAAAVEVRTYRFANQPHLPEHQLRPVTGEATLPAMLRALHPVYPYSVIPGGVYATQELRTALEHDPIARQHYGDFHSGNFRFVMLAADYYSHVSYRQNNQIYWTQKILRIPKGELLLTDGESFARARCGNRLAVDQKTPIAEGEPSAGVLSPPPFRLATQAQPESTVELASIKAENVESLPGGPYSFPSILPPTTTGARTGLSSLNAAWFPSAPYPMFPTTFLDAGEPLKTGGAGNPPRQPAAAIFIPEPEVWALVSAGLIAISFPLQRRRAQLAGRHVTLDGSRPQRSREL